MVKLIGNVGGAAMSCCNMSPPQILVKKENFEADCECPQCQNPDPYSGTIAQFDAVLESMTTNKGYANEFYKNRRNGKLYCYTTLTVSLTAEEKSQDQATTTCCKRNPGSIDATLRISTYQLSGHGDDFSGSQVDSTVSGSTGRPEDLIDLLLASEPEQLEFTQIAPSLAPYLAEKIANSSSLQVLALNTYSADKTVFQSFAKILANRATGPHILRIDGMEFDNDSLSPLCESFKSNTSLRILDMGGTSMSKDWFQFVASGVKLGGLEELDFAECRFDEEDLPEDASTLLGPFMDACKRNTGVRSVKMKNCSIPRELAERVVEAVCGLPNLEELDIDRTDIGNDASSAIGKLLQKEGCKLKTLDMTAAAGTVINLCPIADALHSNKSLTKLKIGGIELEASAGGLRPFAEAMCINSTLSNLHLDTVYCTKDGFDIFFSMLSKMKGLTYLDISDNAMADDVVSVLVQQLALDDIALKHIKAADVQATEAALDALRDAAAGKEREMTLNVSKLDLEQIDCWEYKPSQLLLVLDEKDAVLAADQPPQRYGDGDRQVGDKALLVKYLEEQIADLAKSKYVEPSEVLVHLRHFDSGKPGIEICFDFNSDNTSWVDSSACHVYTEVGKIEDILSVVLALGICKLGIMNELPEAHINALCSKVSGVPLKTLKLISLGTSGALGCMLKETLSSSSTIESLEMHSVTCADQDHMKKLCEGFEGNNSLRTIKIEGCTFVESVLPCFWQGMAHLQALERVDIAFQTNHEES